jgi:hypothetical protein
LCLSENLIGTGFESGMHLVFVLNGMVISTAMLNLGKKPQGQA